MTERAEIQRWMSAAADGDRAAIDPLFQALWAPLVAYAARFVGDRALAEDVAQDAVVKLFGQLDRYDRERDALTWALAIATWECRTARRRTQRRGEHSLAVDASYDGAAALLEKHAAYDGAAALLEKHAAYDAVAALEERELVRAAVATLESLAARDREVIAAALLDDDELRRALAPATFRKRLERALTRLRTSWRSRHGTL